MGDNIEWFPLSHDIQCDGRFGHQELAEDHGRGVYRTGGIWKFGAEDGILFYADDGLIVPARPEWIQWEFDVLVWLLDKVILWTNLKNTMR